MRTKKAKETPTPAPTGERPPDRPPATEWPPRGLSYEDRPGKPKPCLARWREPGGRKCSRSFADSSSRDAFAKQWLKRRETWGAAAPLVAPQQVETWRTFAELTGDADPLMVARFWLRYRAERGGDMTVSRAADRFLEIRASENVSGDTSSHLRLHLRRLVASLGERTLASVKADDVRAWLAGLVDAETGAPFEPYTLRHHLVSAKLLFGHATRERWMDDDPTAAVPLPKSDPEDVTVMPVADAARLFSKNRDALCVGRLALEAFGGLRYSSAARLSKDDIIFAERGIVMPGSKHKLGRRHYVDGHPDNLWAWINHAPQACWDLTARQYLNLKAEAFARAEVKNPGNILRHSFCSYHIALNRDAAATAVLLTHRSPAMLYQHYRGRATHADAEAFFALRP